MTVVPVLLCLTHLGAALVGRWLQRRWDRRDRRRAGRWERAARACLRHATNAKSLQDAQVFCDLEVHHTIQTEKGNQ